MIFILLGLILLTICSFVGFRSKLFHKEEKNMIANNFNLIEKQLIMHEGFRRKAYKDSVGKLTIGIGRNIEDVGITKQEAIFLLRNDIKKVRKYLQVYKWYKRLSPIRKNVIIDMCFNLGIRRFRTFKRMIRALKNENYNMAANEMLDSVWAKQVKTRADRLSKMMQTNKHYSLLG